MWTAAVIFLLFGAWVVVFAVCLGSNGISWRVDSGPLFVRRLPGIGGRSAPVVLEIGREYVAPYALDIRRSYPDDWLSGFTDFTRFEEISLEGIPGGRDFRAFGTAPDLARRLVSDPLVRQGLQQLSDLRDSLFLDPDGVRVRRVIARSTFGAYFVNWDRYVAEATPLVAAAYDLLTGPR